MDLWMLWQLVAARGGFAAVERAGAWQQVGKALDPGAPLTTIAHNARVHYAQLLLEFSVATWAGTSGFRMEKPAAPGAKAPQPKQAKAKPAKPPRASAPAAPRPSRAEVSRPSGSGMQKGGQPSREPWLVPAPQPRLWDLCTEPGGDTAPAPKVKAEPVPNPRTPPNKNQKLMGPLRPSATGQLRPGDVVEVRQLAPGFRGSWYLAKTLQAAKGSVAEGGWRYLVEYEAFRVQRPAAAADGPPVQQGSGAAPGRGGPGDGAAEPNPEGAASGHKPPPQAVGASEAPAERATEWVPLISRSTLDAVPQLLLRRPRDGGPEAPPPPEQLEPGALVEARWQGGWWEARVVGPAPEAGGALRLQSMPEPDGENETWEAAPHQVRCVAAESEQRFGMTAPVEEDDMIPLDRYRRWLRPRDYHCEGYPIESYALAEQLPSSYMPPPPALSIAASRSAADAGPQQGPAATAPGAAVAVQPGSGPDVEMGDGSADPSQALEKASGQSDGRRDPSAVEDVPQRSASQDVGPSAEVLQDVSHKPEEAEEGSSSAYESAEVGEDGDDAGATLDSRGSEVLS